MKPVFFCLLMTALLGGAPVPLLAQTQLSRTLSPAPGSTAPPVADEIVAVVNSEVITRNELRARVTAVERGLQRQGTALPPVDVLNRQVLDRLIDERAELQAARDDGIRVDDFAVDRSIASLAQQNKMSVNAFRDKVLSDGTSYYAFREDVRNEIIMNRLREREVDSNIQVSEGEIDNFLALQGGGTPNSQEFDIAQILIRTPEQATADQIEQARAKADDVYKQATGGGDFSKLAVSYSNAPDALTGGDLGWRTAERYPQLFVDSVSTLNVGDVTKPIKSPNGFHVLKLVGKRTASLGKNLNIAPVLQTHARHILIRVNEVTTEAQAKARLTEIKQRIESGKATFEDMARTYSADGSASKGGDLGEIFPGDTVPEFERAMNSLKVGEISEPVETQFGEHLIQVLGRRTQDVPEERVRLMARQAIHDRKLDEAYQDWLRSVRDEAYVEVRLLDARA
jgi:peptidyl-prolyl cis-trans isomerase SurA